MVARTGRPAGRPRTVGKHDKDESMAKTPKQSSLQSIPEAPEDLDETGKVAWEHVWTEGSEWLTLADYHAATMFAYAWQDIRKIRSVLDTPAAPRTYRMPNGILASNPYVAQLRELQADLWTAISALGLDPTSRKRLELVLEQKEDDKAKMDRRREERRRERMAQNDQGEEE